MDLEQVRRRLDHSGGLSIYRADAFGPFATPDVIAALADEVEQLRAELRRRSEWLAFAADVGPFPDV